MIDPSRRQTLTVASLLGRRIAGGCPDPGLPVAADQDRRAARAGRQFRHVGPHVAQKISEQTGQQAVVENRPGGAAVKASGAVAE